MTAGSAASRRVLARTPVAPLPASSPKRPTGITGRMSAPPETSSPEVCGFRLPLTSGRQWLADAHEALDAAVAAAYGWSADISDDEVLRELLALTHGLARRILRVWSCEG